MSKQRKIVENLFELIDIDGNLEITWNEFLAFQAKAKSTLKAEWPFDIALIRQEFSDLDSDGSGTISKEEFLTVFLATFGQLSDNLSTLESMVTKLQTSPKDKEKLIAEQMNEFDRFDLDGNGSIDFSEALSHMLAALYGHTLNNIFSATIERKLLSHESRFCFPHDF